LNNFGSRALTPTYWGSADPTSPPPLFPTAYPACSPLPKILSLASTLYHHYVFVYFVVDTRNSSHKDKKIKNTQS